MSTNSTVWKIFEGEMLLIKTLKTPFYLLPIYAKLLSIMKNIILTNGNKWYVISNIWDKMRKNGIKICKDIKSRACIRLSCRFPP